MRPASFFSFRIEGGEGSLEDRDPGSGYRPLAAMCSDSNVPRSSRDVTWGPY